MTITLRGEVDVACAAPTALTPGTGDMPIVEALRSFRRTQTLPFSTPGHKLGQGVSAELTTLLGTDLFASDIWLNTADHDAAVRAAEDLAAATWGVDRTLFLTNGSSSGNHAFLLATLNPGDEVVLGRDVHTSILTALILTGARPVYVAPRLHPEFDIGLGPDPDAIADALDRHPAARLVVLTSPTYWGVAADIAAIAGVARARRVPLYVDEAWGPHLPFHPGLPPSAMASGADGAVTSPHKLLSGLSQAAMLHVNEGAVDLPRLATVVRMTQTTSPLVPILASLDACRCQMADQGEALLERTIALADTARQRLQQLPGLVVIDGDRLGLPPRRYDHTRLVVDVHHLGITGFEAEQMLRQRFGIAPEMSDLVSVVCLITIGDTGASINRLVHAFAAVAAEARPVQARRQNAQRSIGEIIAPGTPVLSPRDAFFAPSRAVPLAEAAGEVISELVVPYPPGIPVLAPGERVTPLKVEYLRQVVAEGGFVRGVADPSLATLRVVIDTRDRGAP